MNTYIEHDNSDVTGINVPESFKFQANPWWMQPELWYPVVKFLSFTEDYYSGISVIENPLNLYIKVHLGNMTVEGVPDQAGIITPIYDSPFYGISNMELEFNIVNLSNSTVSKFMVYQAQNDKNDITNPTGELSFRFGFYEGVLHLFVRNNNTVNVYKDMPITIRRIDRVSVDNWFSLENHIKVFGANMMMNIVEDLSIPTVDITFIDSVIIPKVVPFQLRSQLDFTGSNYTELPIQGASHSYDFPDSNQAVYYFGNRHAGQGLFVGKLHRLIDRSASPRFIGTTVQRPNIADVGDGFEYFDVTLQQLLVKYDSGWVNVGGDGGTSSPTYASESVAPLTTGTLTLKQSTQTVINAELTNAHTFTVALPTGIADVVNEAILIFKVGATLPAITLPSGMKWRGSEPTWEINKAYTVSFEAINFGTWEVWGTAIETV